MLFPISTNCQEIFHQPTASLTDTLQLSSFNFTRVLNTYIWSGDFRKDIQSEIWKMEMRQHVRSRLVKTNQVAIQDEYQGFITLNARLSEEWNLQLRNVSSVLADNRVIDLGKMAQHQFLAGIVYIPTVYTRGGVSVGYELNSQEKENDRGFTYGMDYDRRAFKVIKP